MSRLLFVALSVLAFLSSAPVAYAQGAKGLVITPKRVVFEEGQKIVEVLLANRGSSEEKFRISIVNKAMQENGQLADALTPAEGEHFFKEFLRYSPRQIVLGSKQTQKVRLMARLKSDAKEGEYRSHLLIQEIPKAAPPENVGGEADGDLGVNVTAVFGISLPVIIRKGELSAEASLSTPKIEKIGDNTFLTVALNRKGTKSFLGTANVFADSQKIGILRNVAVYLSTPRRVISIKLDPERAKNLSGKNIRITFGAEGENEDAPSAELSFTAP